MKVMSDWRRGFVSLLVVVAGLMSMEARADCQSVAVALQDALRAGDLERARMEYEAIYAQPACDDAFRERAGLALSSLHARIAQERITAGARLSTQRALLERSLQYGRSWPALALLGDEAAARRDPDASVQYYQEALALIDDKVKTPTPPPVAEIERIFKRAAQNRMLATEYHPAPLTRSGAPGGLGADRIRGFVVKQVPIPIGFHTGSDRFTEQGHRAAMELARQLKAQRTARITLAGHTDPRGSVEYNLQLSQERVQAVALFLKDQGYQGDIETLAKGESEPYPVADPSAWSEEERWRMDRRVELIR